MSRVAATVMCGLVCGYVALSPCTVQAEIKLIGTLQIPGTARDQSGLTDELAPGLPHNQLSAGSGIAYTGKGHRYLLLPDRGPADGASTYRCRWHFVDIRVRPGATPPVAFDLQKTVLLTSESGQPLTGSLKALDPRSPAQSLRFDAEGVRIGPKGEVFVSDEYGPDVAEFTANGKRLRTLSLPARFRPETYDIDPKAELAANSRGRQPNGGFEGLAISPQGDRLFAIIQKPLLQDGASNPDKPRAGTNLRIVELELASGATREFVYPLEAPEHGVSEILAVNDHALLVLERDSLAGNEAKFKRIYRAELQHATDVSRVDALPSQGVPEGVQAASKSLFLDLLDPKFGLAGETFPGKVEGLCFGPDLPNGEHLLIVTADNDFRPEAPNLFYTFSVPAEDLPGYAKQHFKK